MKTALFPGSFDPFTIGHYDIVLRSLALFDNIVIGIGINSNKKYMFDLETRIANIKNVFADEPRVSVEKYDGLTIDFARQCGACCIVRGIRTNSDFEYEQQLAQINQTLSQQHIDTIFLCSQPQHSMISSSFVRELNKFGQDITPFLPPQKDLKI